MANAIYERQGTQKVIRGSGGDAVITMTGIVNAAGRISAQIDLGAFPRAYRYRLTVQTRATSALAVGATMPVYVRQSDGTYSDGGSLGTADAAVAAESAFYGCTFAGAVVADSTTPGAVQSHQMIVEIHTRYAQVGIINNLGQTLTATESDHIITLTPLYDEVQ